MTVLGTRFSATDIIIITIGVTCLLVLGLVIGFGPIFIVGTFFLVIIDSIYFLYYIKGRERRV